MIKVRTKNLFNKNWEVISAYLTPNSTWQWASDSTSWRVKVKPNTTYAISATATNQIFRVAFVASDVVPTSTDKVVPCYRAFDGSSPMSNTFTTQSDTQYIVIQVGTSASAETKPTICVNEGSSAIAYTPYMETVKKIFTKQRGRLNAVKKVCIKNNNYHLLPNGYTLVDGLITDGVAYVDTGIVPDTTSKWDFEGTFKIAQSGDQVIMGSREDSGNTRFFPFATAATGGAQKFNYAYSTYAYGNDITLNVKSYITVHLEAGSQSSQVEGSARPDTRGLDFPEGTVLTKPMYLFRNNYTSPNECKDGLTCWYIKVVKDGVTIGEFVSCKRDSDNSYGVYDLVTNTFKGNSNTSGTLTGGQDIVEVEYLQSSGTEYIDTGLKGNQDTEFDITAQYVGASTSSLAGLFGTRTAAQNKAVIVAGYANQVIAGFGNEETQVVFDFYEHNFKLDDGDYYYDGVLKKSFSPSTFTTDSTMILFGRRQGSGMSLSAWKVKKCYVTNGTAVRDYVPIRIGTTGCLLDKENWRIYENAGTGAFTYGGDERPYKVVFNALPSEYQEVEYIASNGTEYLDLGFKANNNTRFVVDWKINNAGRFFGSNDTDANFRATYSSTHINIYYVYYGASSNIGVTVDDITTRHTFDWNKNKIYVNNELKTTLSSQTFTATSNFGLFNFYPVTSATYTGATLYGCKVYDNDKLVRSFIPCYRKSDNVAGLYDIVNDVFYTNQGTGSFTKGADIY